MVLGQSDVGIDLLRFSDRVCNPLRGTTVFPEWIRPMCPALTLERVR